MSEPFDGTGLEQRSAERRKRLVVHRAASHEDAEAWDLETWQQQTPEARLSALVAIRRDVEVIEAGRKSRKGEEREEDARVLRLVRDRRDGHRTS
jgi:hypothetical protein